eukprot:753776-Hanusia_phi.AAC.15
MSPIGFRFVVHLPRSDVMVRLSQSETLYEAVKNELLEWKRQCEQEVKLKEFADKREKKTQDNLLAEIEKGDFRMCPAVKMTNREVKERDLKILQLQQERLQGEAVDHGKLDRERRGRRGKEKERGDRKLRLEAKVVCEKKISDQQQEIADLEKKNSEISTKLVQFNQDNANLKSKLLSAERAQTAEKNEQVEQKEQLQKQVNELQMLLASAQKVESEVKGEEDEAAGRRKSLEGSGGRMGERRKSWKEGGA